MLCGSHITCTILKTLGFVGSSIADLCFEFGEICRRGSEVIGVYPGGVFSLKLSMPHVAEMYAGSNKVSAKMVCTSIMRSMVGLGLCMLLGEQKFDVFFIKHLEFRNVFDVVR